MPGVDRDFSRETEHLHHRSAGEGVHDGAVRWLHFCRGFAHLDPCDAFDFSSQYFNAALEKLTVKLLHLHGTLRGSSEGLFSGRQYIVQRDDERVAVAEGHVYSLGCVTRLLLLEDTDRLDNLLCHRETVLFHRIPPEQLPSSDISINKKADVAEHQQVFDHVGLLVNKPPATSELLSH